MGEYTKIPQKHFNSLDHFIKHSNNYWNYWTNYERGETMREFACYQRFLKKYPEFSKRLIEKTTAAVLDRHSELPWEERLPWKELYASYKRIENLVFEEDFVDSGLLVSELKGFLVG